MAMAQLQKIYALLVGIDCYPDPVPFIQGCVNDITAIAASFSERIKIKFDRIQCDQTQGHDPGNSVNLARISHQQLGRSKKIGLMGSDVNNFASASRESLSS
jgi:hypothetical protein